MLLAALREEVLEANLDLVRTGLVLSTFGNASGVDRKEGLIVIKPSGVAYEAMKPGDLVVTDLQGKVMEGTLRPESHTHIQSTQQRGRRHVDRFRASELHTRTISTDRFR